jgi:hypothetical protein
MTPKNPASEFDGPSGGGVHPNAVTTFQQLSKLRQRLLRLVQTFQKLTLVFSLHSAVLSEGRSFVGKEWTGISVRRFGENVEFLATAIS